MCLEAADCHEMAECVEVEGDSICVCQSGYFGDGKDQCQGEVQNETTAQIDQVSHS